MTSLIKILILVAVCFTATAQINYKKDGEFRLIADVHLINDIEYKKGGGYQALVEIPSGTRQKWEVDHKSGQLEWEFRDEKPREIKFLAYPGNYGFIPQTLSGDNDPLDIIVLSENVNRGSVLQVKVIGMLILQDGGESDNKIIAIVENGAFDNIDTLQEMLLKKPNVISIVTKWFTGYKKPGKMVFIGYEGMKKTIKYIEKAHTKWKFEQKR